MQRSKRQDFILERLETEGACSYSMLARMLKVSEMTVRRDVEEMVAAGSAIKSLGGVQTALPPKQYYEAAFQQRLESRPREKRQIAHAALRDVQTGQTLFLDGSTTCLALATALAQRASGLTVVTHSGPVCMELGRNKSHTVLCLGGQFDAQSACFVGPSAEEGLEKLFVDTTFISTKGFVPEEGTFESARGTFRVKQLVAKRCARVVLLVDHTKFDQRALHRVLETAQIHEVITDAGATPEVLERIERRGVAVRVAASEPAAQEA